jgi:uncharacterized membrane protein (UPF0182 family)
VFTTQLWARLGLLLVFGLGMALIVGLNMWLAYHYRPVFRIMSPEQQSLERYRMALDPIRRFAFIAIPAFLGLLAGVSATAEWQTYLEWRNATEFGVTDPQFGLDVSFYVFQLPFLRFVLGFLFAVVVLSFLTAFVVHYLYGGIRLQPADDRFSRAAQAHLMVLVGIFVLLKAGAYWLDRYELSLSTDDFVPGMTYKDVNALLPGLTILTWISLICALLFFFAAFRNAGTLAVTSLVLLVGSALLVGSIYPAFVQSVQVRPTENEREAPFIQRNIDATRAAYGLADVEVTPYAASETATEQAIEASKGTIDNIRLLDPAIVSPTFRALQQIRSSYRFPDSLDVDRYTLEGERRGATIAVREINLEGIPASQRNWNNDHIVYTHGFGVVAAYDNTSIAGQPAFFEKDLPPTGLLDVDQPRIYFGEYSPPYSIVGAPEGAAPQELDFPDDNAPNGQASYTYTGKGGIDVGSPINKLLFTAKYQEPNILLSDNVNEASKILEVRDPRERVEKVAPWLTVDGDPYPVVVEGRVLWDPSLTEMAKPDRAPIFEEMNRVIAALHRVDAQPLGLADYGRPGNYFERQIGRWSKQYLASITEPIPAMDALIAWLPQHMPAASREEGRTGIVHGDFRLDNLLFHPSEPRVLAVLDWELSTLGHPMADMAYHCMSWHIPPGQFRGIGGLDLPA